MARPNVVFIIDDQHRWDFMGYEGNGVTHAPNLDRLAKRGAILHSAYYTSPLCSPSRAAIASGRYGMNTGCFTNLHELPPGTPSFVNQLREDGYHTCAVGKTHMEIHAYDADYTSAKHRSYMESLGWCEVHEISGQGMLRTGIKCEHSEFLRQRGALEEAVEFYQQWHYFMDKESQAPNPPYAGGHCQRSFRRQHGSAAERLSGCGIATNRGRFSCTSDSARPIRRWSRWQGSWTSIAARRSQSFGGRRSQRTT